jgi:hypothetical protein
VAVRERRELAREVTGADRELVLPLVEADRREQIGRAQAMAERRVERRQGMGVGELKEQLLTQARALRARLGRELGRVKEWIAERFPDPLQQLKDRSRDLFDTVTEKVREALGRGAGPERGDVTPHLQGDLFDGVPFSAGPAQGFAALHVASTPAAPAETASMSLAEQLEVRSNAVAERLEREARAQPGQGIEEDAFWRARGLDAPGRGRAAGRAGAEGGGEVASQRLQPSDGATELTLEQQLHARADEVAQRVGQELERERAARAEIDRQRALEGPEEDEERGRGRGLGRSLGDDDDDFNLGHRRGRGR